MDTPAILDTNQTKQSVRGWKKPFFALTAVLLSLSALEAGSRLYLGLRPNARWESGRSQARMIGFPALNELLTVDDRLFWKLKPNLNDYTVSGHIGVSLPIRFSVTTNDAGMRVMPVIESAQRRILFIGDSCTFGLGVENNQTFPAVIQECLPGVQCVNAGVPGYTSFQGRIWLEQLPANPPFDTVVITFGFNDDLRWDNMSDLRHSELIARERTQLLNQSRLLELMSSLMARKAPKTAEASERTRPRLNCKEFEQQILEILEICRARGARPILVIWPYTLQVLENGAATAKQRALRRIAAREHVELVDLTTVFKGREGAALFIDSIHAGPHGNRLVAETLLPHLRRGLPEAVQSARP